MIKGWGFSSSNSNIILKEIYYVYYNLHMNNG